MRRYGRVLALLLVAIAAVVLALRPGSAAVAEEAVAWLRGAGAAGILAFGVAYVVATVLLVPMSTFTLAAGFVWGTLAGTAIVSVASVTGAAVAFAIGRTLARDRIERLMASRPRASALLRAVRGDGIRTVLLLRLSPLVPFNLLNYALALTGVRALPFVLGSWLGMLPGTFLYVYIGASVRDLTQLTAGARPTPTAERALFWIGLAATAALVMTLTRRARRELDRLGSGTEPAAR